MSKDKIIIVSLCGRGEKDLDQIEERIGKDSTDKVILLSFE